MNSHKEVYVERAGVLELTNVAFKDDAHLMHIIDKIVSGWDAAWTSRRRWWTRVWQTVACQRHHSATGGRRPCALDPPIRNVPLD